MSNFISFTKKQLNDAMACPHGIETFHKNVGFKRKMEWTPMLEILVRSCNDRDIKLYFLWLVRHNLVPSFSFRGAHLKGSLLESAFLDDMNFQNVNLNDSHMKWAIANNCNFSYAQLLNVDFTGAELSNCNFQNSYLTGSNLSGADLQGANLFNAQLDNVNLTNIVYDMNTRWPSGFKVPRKAVLANRYRLR